MSLKPVRGSESTVVALVYRPRRRVVVLDEDHLFLRLQALGNRLDLS
jgi:hypothetical protein